MIRDKFGQVFYTQDQVCELLYQKPDLDISTIRYQDPQKFNSSNRKLYAGYSELKHYQELDIDVNEFDQKNQNCWRMPQQYREFDIGDWLLQQCQTEQQRDRVLIELVLFHETNLIPLLCYLKYMVDVMTENNLIWGVGRGSSTASYILYLIGLHSVDCLKYQIPIEEFFKLGE